MFLLINLRLLFVTFVLTVVTGIDLFTDVIVLYDFLYRPLLGLLVLVAIAFIAIKNVIIININSTEKKKKICIEGAVFLHPNIPAAFSASAKTNKQFYFKNFKCK